jgi:malic enzyme
VDLIAWTEGRAIVGTGSPFDDVIYDGRRHRIGQGNNVFIFPGMGLGTIVARARKVTDGMFLAAAKALAACVSEEMLAMSCVYPRIDEVRKVSRAVAAAVARRAAEEGVAEGVTDLEARIERAMWDPVYLPYRAVRA